MATRKTKTFSLTRHHEKLIERMVKSGRYQSSSEVIRDALRSLEEQEELRSAVSARIRRLVEEGLHDSESGHLIDGRAAADHMRRRFRASRKKAG